MKRKTHVTLLVTLMMVPMIDSGAARGEGVASTRYGVIDLGTLGGVESRAFDVNIHGEVVGWSLNSSGDERAFLWLPRAAYGLPAGMNDLGVLPTANESNAYSINVHGQVVGWSRIEDPNDPGIFIRKAFLWENGAMTNLGVPMDRLQSAGTTINEHGQVAGWWSNGRCCSSSVYLWLPEAAFGLPAGPNDLGFIQPFEINEARKINSLGQIAGGTFTDAGTTTRTAFLWLPSSAYGLGPELNNLGTFGGVDSYGTSINEQGQLVGWWRPTDQFAPARGFLWENGVMTDLGTLNDEWTFPEDINRWSQIVGWSSGSLKQALIWEDNNLFNLNDLIPGDSGWVLNAANAINDRGRIAGYGIIDGETHAFLLNPVTPLIPTVSTYGLIILAIILLIVGTVVIQRKRDLTNQTLIL